MGCRSKPSLHCADHEAGQHASAAGPNESHVPETPFAAEALQAPDSSSNGRDRQRPADQDSPRQASHSFIPRGLTEFGKPLACKAPEAAVNTRHHSLPSAEQVSVALTAWKQRESFCKSKIQSFTGSYQQPRCLSVWWT